MDEPFQTVVNLMKTQCACNFSFKKFDRFQRFAPFPPTVCQAASKQALWGLGQPVIRQECRKSLQSHLDYSKIFGR
jgi:hypothetical protein